jgi:hypothetical protein
MNKSYLTYFLYGATGEGLTRIVAHVIAQDEETAIRNVMKQHMTTDEEGIEYYGRGVAIIDLGDRANHPQAREWLGQFLNNDMVEYIMEAETAGALHGFVLKCYVNYS